MVVGTTVLTILIQWTKRTLPSDTPSTKIDSGTQRRLRWRIRLNKSYVVVLAIGLIYVISQARDLPVISLIVGIPMNQLLMWSAIGQIRRLKSRLNQLS